MSVYKTGVSGVAIPNDTTPAVPVKIVANKKSLVGDIAIGLVTGVASALIVKLITGDKA